jgi:hypothetical protein
VTRDELQALFDATPEGGTLDLPIGEYDGPFVIRHFMRLVGANNPRITFYELRPDGDHYTADGISVEPRKEGDEP